MILYLICGYYFIGLAFCFYGIHICKKDDPSFMSDSNWWISLLFVVAFSTIWFTFVPALIEELRMQYWDK